MTILRAILALPRLAFYLAVVGAIGAARRRTRARRRREWRA